MSKFEAVIFDMDGVIVDDFAPWLEFDKSFLAQFGQEPDDEYIRYVNGRSEEEVTDWIIDKFNLSLSREDIFKLRQTELQKIYGEYAQPMPDAEALLTAIQAKGYKQAIATAAKQWEVDLIVKRFNWQKYFDVIVSSDSVDYKGKPDPAIYLHAAEKLTVKPENCVVFEDADNGVKSAKQAGMYCIGFKDNRRQADLSGADLIIDSLIDKQIYNFLGL